MTQAAAEPATAVGRRRRPGCRLAAIAATGVSIALIGCAPPAGTPSAQHDVATDVDSRPVNADTTAVGANDDENTAGIEPERAASPVSLPVAVEIPRLGVDAELVALGINDDGSMEVPEFGRAGWYANGPRPGAPGPAVIAAHYDSRDGPDVFSELATLEPGDEVHVRGADSSTTRFIVERREQTPKDALPADRIWATTDEARLTLITCGGTFDRTIGHYTDNVIVYATRVG